MIRLISICSTIDINFKTIFRMKVLISCFPAKHDIKINHHKNLTVGFKDTWQLKKYTNNRIQELYKTKQIIFLNSQVLLNLLSEITSRSIAIYTEICNSKEINHPCNFRNQLPLPVLISAICSINHPSTFFPTMDRSCNDFITMTLHTVIIFAQYLSLNA